MLPQTLTSTLKNDRTWMGMIFDVEWNSTKLKVAPGRCGSRAQSMVERELDHWRQFCGKRDHIECLRACEAEIMKAYLEWRVVNFCVRKESTIQSYWKRIRWAYIDVTGRRIDDGSELDIRDWIPTFLTPTYGLITSEKEKRAMFVQEFYVLEYAHWIEDRRRLHGLVRVEIWTMHLLSAATSTRPGALAESGSAKGTNRAVWFEHIEILKLRHPADPSRTIMAVKVDLGSYLGLRWYRQTTEKSSSSTKEPTWAFCLVYPIVAVAFALGAFRRPFTSVQEILDLRVPGCRRVLRLKFKPEMLSTPFFRDVVRTDTGFRVSTKALPYHKYRAHHIHLGRLVGQEEVAELYDLRRGSGRNIHS